MNIGVPTPNIDVSVTMRNLSGWFEERARASKILKGPEPLWEGNRRELFEHLRDACYAQ